MTEFVKVESDDEIKQLAGLAKEMEEYRVRLREAVENDNKKING